MTAAEVEAQSKVHEVTVFPDRALVSRVARVTLPAGSSTVVVSGLPASMVEGSLRASCESKTSVKIGAVGLNPVRHVDLVREEEKALSETLQKLEDKKKEAENRVKAFEARIEFIQAIGREAPKTANQEVQRNHLEPETWKAAWEALEGGLLEAHRGIQGAENDKRRIEEEIAKAEQDLSDISSGRKQENQAKIHLEMGSLSVVEMTLRYLVMGASWHPQYDIRLDSVKEKVSLDQLAEIRQNTGEDWLNARLTLSTARPSEGMRAPVLSEWSIAVRPAPTVGGKTLTDAQINAIPLDRSSSNIIYLAPSAVSSRSKEFEAAARPEAAAEVVSSEFLAEYQIHGEVDVPSDNLGHKYTVLQHEMEVKLAARVVPKLVPRAFLLAHGTYKGSAPLLPGPMVLYRDGAFVGSDRLEMLRSGGEVDFPLGIDDKILVSYTRDPDQKGEKGFLSKGTRVDRWYEIKLANRHTRAMEITVVDQIPVTEDEHIKVEVAKDSKVPTARDYEKKKGVFSWVSTLNPEEKISFRFGYSVTAPEGIQVVGF
jgi:uncharacterized protein (TIGR02231 family)